MLDAGLDEVGRGPVAGPICIAVVAFHKGVQLQGVNDSKQLTARRREELIPPILESAAFVGIGWASPRYIDEKGIAAAWQYAANMALQHAPISNMLLTVDGRDRVDNYEGKQRSVVKADGSHYPTSAASIVAKVSRDLDMLQMSERYQGYGWERNSGYGTKEHREAILELGVTPYHRRSFLRKWVKKYGLRL
jgi:ribonuclease HII